MNQYIETRLLIGIAVRVIRSASPIGKLGSNLPIDACRKGNDIGVRPTQLTKCG